MSGLFYRKCEMRAGIRFDVLSGFLNPRMSNLLTVAPPPLSATPCSLNIALIVVRYPSV